MPEFAGCAFLVRFSRLAVSAAALVACVGAAPWVLAPVSATAAPEPDPVPKRWELNITPGPLRIATVDVPGVGPASYLYFTYKAVNNTGQDLLFAPAFELSTDEGDLISAGRGVPFAVTDEMLARLDDPFLEDQINIIGQILQGEENAKEGLVIWPVPTAMPGMITVYCKGFSGETKAIEIPDPASGEVQRITLSKQFMLRYVLPGELNPKDSSPLAVSERRWIMR